MYMLVSAVNPHCGNESRPQPHCNHSKFHSSPLKGELPITKVFKVDHISAARHEKFGGGPIPIIPYYCGVKMYTEYVVFENTNPFVTRRAKAWWKLRMQ